MRKQFLFNAAKYGLGFALLGYVIWKYWTPPPGTAGPGLAEALQGPIQLVPLALAVSIGTCGVLLTFIRWYVLVRAQHLPFTLGNALRLGLIGFYVSTFLPGSIGGDVLKAAFLAREQSRRTVAVATVLIDRAIGLWGLVWLTAVLGGVFWLGGDPALLEKPALMSIVWSAWTIIAVSIVVWLVAGVLPAHRAHRFAGRLERLPKIGHSMAEFWRALWMYRCQRAHVALALLLSIVGHVGFVLTFYYCAQIFQPADGSLQIPTMAEHFLIVPIGMCFQALFPAPGGVGGAEYAYGWLYEQIGKPAANGVLGSLAQRVITWILGLIGYIVYLRTRPEEQPARDEDTALVLNEVPVG